MRLSQDQRTELEKRVLGDLLGLVNPENVLMSTPSGALLLNGVPVTDQELRNLQSEVQVLKHMKVWAIFQENLKFEAQRDMFVNSEDFDAMRSGKMLLYALATQAKIIKTIERAKGKPSKPKTTVIR